MIYKALAVLVLVFQVIAWDNLKDIKPKTEIIPAVPSEVAVEALSFGDKQFYYRVMALGFQNFGDMFGQFTPLYKYEYDKLYRWLNLLDSLDKKSSFTQSLASYYYSQTQARYDNRYISYFLYESSKDHVQDKWWWLTQSGYLANQKMNDFALALKVIEPLEQAQDVPIWVKQLPAFIYEKTGEFDAALSIMQGLAKNADDLDAGELAFINHFIKERIQKLDGVQ